MYNILLVDDDKDVLDTTKGLLEMKGYNVKAHSNSKQAILDAIENDYDLCIVDYVMPDIGGESFVDICNSAKKKFNIVIYSGIDDFEKEYNMLDKNIIEFVSKSMDPRLFVKRIERILEKNKVYNIEHHDHNLTSKNEDIELDCVNRRVTHKGEIVALTTLEFLILSLFLSMKNKPLSREYIHSIVWESRGFELEEFRTIDLYILKLRKKLDLKSLLSVRGVGYVWAEKE